MKRTLLAGLIAVLLVSHAHAGWRFSRTSSCSGGSCSVAPVVCTNGNCTASGPVYQAPVAYPVQQAYQSVYPVVSAPIVQPVTTPIVFPVAAGCVNGRCSR